MQKLFDQKLEFKDKLTKNLKISSAIVAGICLFFILFPKAFFDFVGTGDAQLKNSGWPIADLQADRVSMLVSDAWRSLILILIAAGSLFLFLNNTIKKNALIFLLGIFILGDMWSVNKRYLDNESFQSKKKVEQPFVNTKYFIIKGQNSPVAQLNPNAFGNAWFVNEVIKVENADQEIDTIGVVDLRYKAVVDKRFDYSSSFEFDSLATINLTSYKANHLIYESKSTSSQFAVFSEVFYDKGWNAYINDELVPHYRANYILRALNIPAGENKVEFKFEPQTFKTGEQISLASSIILLLLILGVVYKEFK